MPGVDENEAHRAIGHYLTTFSELVRDMREGIEYALGNGRSHDDEMIPRLALGEAFADQIANSYFAICERSFDLDDEEKQVGVRLKVEVKDAIKQRNDFAHGDWYFGQNWAAPGSDHDPRLLRTKPGRRSGATVEMVRPIREIDEMAESLAILDNYVSEFGWLCLGMHPLEGYRGFEVRVRDIFRFSKHRVLRTGRYADEHWWPEDEPDEVYADEV